MHGQPLLLQIGYSECLLASTSATVKFHRERQQDIALPQ